MTTLFNISQDLSALEALLSEMEGDITNEQAEAAIDEWLARIEGDLEAKLDSYGYLIREFQSRANVRHEEAIRLTSLGASDQANADRLKARLKNFFEVHGIQKKETPHFKLWMQANGGKAPLLCPADWEAEPARAPERFQRRVIQVDKENLRAVLESGEAVEGCSILERARHLRIK